MIDKNKLNEKILIKINDEVSIKFIEALLSKNPFLIIENNGFRYEINTQIDNVMKEVI